MYRRNFRPVETKCDALIAGIREYCMQKSAAKGILGLATEFRKMDKDFSKAICFDEFRDGLEAFGIDLPRPDLRLLFDNIDKNKNGTIDFKEFLDRLKPPIASCRREVVEEAFEKLDANNDGILKIDDLKLTYGKQARLHPEYQSGQKSLDQVLQTFLDAFDDPDSPDGVITKEEFLNYYAGVSIKVDDDSYFDLLMRTCWDLPQRGMNAK